MSITYLTPYLTSVYIAGTTSAPNADYTILKVSKRKPDSMTESEWEKARPPVVCVAVHSIKVTGFEANLNNLIEAHLEADQLSIFKSFIDKRAKNQQIGVQFAVTDFDKAAIGQLAVSGRKDYLKASSIMEWFDNEISSGLLGELLTRFNNDTTKAATVAGNYKELLSKFAGPAYAPQLPVLEKLKSVIEGHVDDIEASPIAERILTRINKQIEVASSADQML